jgi:hypothetical protein
MEGFKRNSNIEPEPIKVPEMKVELGGLTNEEAMKNEAALKMKAELDKISPETMAKNIANPENRKRLNDKLQIILLGFVALGLATFFVESLIDLINNPAANENYKTWVETIREMKVGFSAIISLAAGFASWTLSDIYNKKWNKLEKAK